MYSQRYDSQQYLPAIVEAEPAGVFYDPTGDTVQYQIVAAGQNPAGGAWLGAVWQTITSGATPSYRALCMVGPNGPFVPKQGTTMWLFLKITDNPEIPVLGPMSVRFT